MRRDQRLVLAIAVLAIAVLAIAVLASFLGGTVVKVALPASVRELGGGLTPPLHEPSLHRTVERPSSQPTESRLP